MVSSAAPRFTITQSMRGRVGATQRRPRGRRWEVGGGEEAFRQDAVGGQRLEARLGEPAKAAGESRATCRGEDIRGWKDRGSVGAFKRCALIRNPRASSCRVAPPARRPAAPAAAAIAQEPAARHHGRDTTRVTHLPELNVTVTRTTEPLERVPVRGRRPGSRRTWSGTADGRHRRGAQQPAGRGGGEPVQLLPRPADLDPRVRQPLQLRGARAQDPGGRDPPDPARRTEPAHQRGLRRPRARRGAAGVQLVALRQRVRRGDLLPDQRERRASPSRSGCGCRAATASGPATASTSGRAGPRAGR